MLGVCTVVIMLVVAYAFWREGLLTAVTMCVNVFVAGLIAFNFWEPLADLLDLMFANTILAGYEDALCLVLLFGLVLATLRWVTNSLAPAELEYHPGLHRGGTVLFGLATGYLVAGFLVCVLQTLPWHDHFMYFDPRYDPEQPAAVVRQVLPPDRVWLALMRRAGAYAFSNSTDEDVTDPETPDQRYVTFDKYGTFELRYARYRRYDDSGDNPRPYLGEFDRQLQRKSR
jgi:colicin V production protein